MTLNILLETESFLLGYETDFRCPFCDSLCTRILNGLKQSSFTSYNYRCTKCMQSYLFMPTVNEHVPMRPEFKKVEPPAREAPDSERDVDISEYNHIPTTSPFSIRGTHIPRYERKRYQSKRSNRLDREELKLMSERKKLGVCLSCGGSERLETMGGMPLCVDCRAKVSFAKRG